MAQNEMRFSLDRRDKKLAGVCSTLGDLLNVDPTFVRVGFVAALFLIGWEVALVTYVAAGIYFSVKRRQASGESRGTEFDRMEHSTSVRPSVHAVRTQLDPIDRRLMAIDDHIAKPNRELAREIDALREEK